MDNKISTLELLILAMLARNEKELYGLEMIRFSGGMLKKQTLYTTLKRMEDKKLIKGRTEKKRDNGRGLPRRFYRLLSKGQNTVDEYQELLGWGER